MAGVGLQIDILNMLTKDKKIHPHNGPGSLGKCIGPIILYINDKKC